MSVNLQKGQRVDLRKTSGTGSLKQVMVGLGWDEVQKRHGCLASVAPKISTAMHLHSCSKVEELSAETILFTLEI